MRAADFGRICRWRDDPFAMLRLHYAPHLEFYIWRRRLTHGKPTYIKCTQLILKAKGPAGATVTPVADAPRRVGADGSRHHIGDLHSSASMATMAPCTPTMSISIGYLQERGALVL